jgi:hypothetical protein
VVSLGIGAAAASLAFRQVVHPWMATWGATDAELGRHFPEDDLVVSGAPRTTRAITIDAPPREVWRWLVQIGEDRAGFYSYWWLERLALAHMHNADEIHEEWQHRARGDTVWLGQWWGELGRQVAAACDPDRAFVMVSPKDFATIESGARASGYWGFFLEPSGGHGTRLIARSSGGAVGTALFDTIHFVMEQKMMRGIKARAERLAVDATRDV